MRRKWLRGQIVGLGAGSPEVRECLGGLSRESLRAVQALKQELAAAPGGDADLMKPFSTGGAHGSKRVVTRQNMRAVSIWPESLGREMALWLVNPHSDHLYDPSFSCLITLGSP